MDLELTEVQLKAAKAVYRAMRKASKLGVVFWDNYGTLQCYNARKITTPVPDESKEISLDENDPTYYERLDNFISGNADDPLFFDRV
ncbi:MAG TPA: hypothetical protein VK982_12375 [Bacteroidales bacterium]|nr:hypothetical protein [Bacteroidales bacterium]